MKLLPPSLLGAQAALPPLDATQSRVLDAIFASHGHVLVTGAPGTGKTRLAVEIVRRAVSQGIPSAKIAVLAATRRGAGKLRDVVTQAVETPMQGSAVRTPAALAFSILTARAASQGLGIPRLITGGEQDQLLADILTGYEAGWLDSPTWPDSIPPETLGLRGFRAELRDLLMRTAENGLDAAALDHYGKTYGREEWRAAAAVLRDYEDVTSLSSLVSDVGRRYDPAQIVSEAARELAAWTQADRPTWELVIADDYQEATAATARLLTVLADHGAQLIMLGDPDVAVQGFRGARPTLMGVAGAANPGSLAENLGHFDARVEHLDTVWRGGGDVAAQHIRSAVQKVTGSIASVGVVAHRGAQALRDDSDVQPSPTSAGVRVQVLPTQNEEERYIARHLRTQHLRHETQWSDMAVICRSGSELVRMRRALSALDVPVAVVGTDVPLRDEPAVRPLLTTIRACLEGFPIETAIDLITSVIGGADAIGLRRVRHALRKEELSAGGGRNSDALILEALERPEYCATLGSRGAPLARVARVIQAGQLALQAPGATPQTVLWAVWQASGLAEIWQRTALTGGAAAGRANRDLDAVLALFRAAETYVDRLPEADTASFVAFVEAQDIPADSLAQPTTAGGRVTLTTPAGAAGNEWPVVVVAGVQEGTWPDLRLRDSLLGAATLVEIISGRASDARGLGENARREVFYDELRSYALALSRASRYLLVTAVSDVDLTPSPFVTMLAPPRNQNEAEAEARTEGVSAANRTDAEQRTAEEKSGMQSPQSVASGLDPHNMPLDLRGLVAVLRAELMAALEAGDEPLATSRTNLLSYLAQQGVLEAQPTHWYASAELSSTNSLYEKAEHVSISPSRVESVARCPLRWSLETSGGTPRSGLAQSVGTLVHAIAADYPAGSFQELAAELDARWHELGMPDGWPARRQKEQARSMLEHLAQYYATKVPPSVTRVLVEQDFNVTVGGARLVGIVDRLEITENATARVVDLKTGKRMNGKAEAATNPQLGVYQLALQHGAFENVTGTEGAHLVYLASGNKSVALRDQPALPPTEDNWAAQTVSHAVDVMRSATFTAKPNEMCPTCPVRRSCPINSEGQHVVPIAMSVTRTENKTSSNAAHPEDEETR